MLKCYVCKEETHECEMSSYREVIGNVSVSSQICADCRNKPIERVLVAKQQICTCEEPVQKHIHVAQTEWPTNDIPSIDHYYCVTCNSHWTEV